MHKPTLMLTSLLTVAAAQSAPVAKPTQPTMEIFRIETVTVDGKKQEKRTPVTSVRPGDLIERVVTVNVMQKTNKAALTIPVPVELNFVAGSQWLSALGKTVDLNAGGAKVLYSLSEKGPYSEKPMKTVTVTRDGKQVTEQVAAAPNEYRALRFELGTIEPGVYVLKHRVTVR